MHFPRFAPTRGYYRPAPYWVSAPLAPEPYHIRLVLPWPFNVTSTASRCGELDKQRHHPQKRNTHHGYNSSLHAMNEPTQDSTKAILSPRKPKVKPGPCKQPLSSISEPYDTSLQSQLLHHHDRGIIYQIQTRSLGLVESISNSRWPGQ